MKTDEQRIWQLFDVTILNDYFLGIRVELRNIFHTLQLTTMQAYPIVGTYQVLCLALENPEKAIREGEQIVFPLHRT